MRASSPLPLVKPNDPRGWDILEDAEAGALIAIAKGAILPPTK